MTDILLDPNDTGEIPRYDSLGIEPTRDLRDRIDTGEATQRIDPRLIKAPSFDAIPRRVIDLDDTVVYMPETIGCVDLEGPQKPPPPLPPPPKDMAATQPIAPWERVIDTEGRLLLGSAAGLDGDLREAPLPRPIPPSMPPRPKPSWRDEEPSLWQRITHRAKHRRSSPWWGLAQLAVLVVAAGAVGWWLA